jgi:hypothetical protein
MTQKRALVAKPIENQIRLVRGQKVLLDSDLAGLYGVEVRALNQAVKRNEGRFPRDFVFQLTAKESEVLRSQTVISNSSRGGRRYLPNAFTEHGADGSMKNKKITLLALAFVALLLVPVVFPGATCEAQVDSEKSPYPTMAPPNQYLMPDRNSEIALARSAAPSSISGGAEMLVLERAGYATAAAGLCLPGGEVLRCCH